MFKFIKIFFNLNRIHWDAHVLYKKKEEKSKAKKTITKGVQYVYAMMSVNERS
jgi:hypothetical protein